MTAAHSCWAYAAEACVEHADPTINAALMANSPMRRPAQPEEITGIVLFLCSPATSFATGQVYLVDGGQTAH